MAVRRAFEFCNILDPRSGTRPEGDVELDWKRDVEAGVNATAVYELCGAVDVEGMA